MKSPPSVILSVAVLLVASAGPTSLSAGLTDWGKCATVQSETDGNGLFTYTLTAGTDPLTFTPGQNDMLELLFCGLEEIYSPADWESSSTPEGVIQWTYTGADPLTLSATPIVFSAQSSIPQSQLWAVDLGPPLTSYGVVNGQTESDGYGIDVFQPFSFIAPVPEPSSLALFLVGAASAGFVSRLRKRRERRSSVRARYSTDGSPGSGTVRPSS